MAPDPGDVARLVAGVHHDPHSILGATSTTTTRCCARCARMPSRWWRSSGGRRYEFSHVDAGLFAVALPFTNLADYRLEVSYPAGETTPTLTVADGYRFLPTLGEMDLHLFAEGATSGCGRSSAPPRSFTTPDGGGRGVSFAVWAPNAKGVSLIGEFNHWDGNDAPMRVLGSSGCGSCSGPTSPPTASTSSGCTASTVGGPTAPTRSPSPPRFRADRVESERLALHLGWTPIG